MEIIKLGLALEPDHTVSLSLVDVPGTGSGVAAVEPEEPVSSVHFFAYRLSDQR